METSIVELNKDVEQFVIQAAQTRSKHSFQTLCGDKFKPLCFVHAADIHDVISAWNRMTEYINHYSEYISFAVHTGDYCGGSQQSYTDFYAEGEKCVRPIYNCPGNHDCFSGEGAWLLNDKKIAHGLLYNHTEDWDVNFMDIEYSMSYYKDFPESNIRMIVLDDYYHIDETREWLRGVLLDARKKELSVITAQHETMSDVVDFLPVKYNSIDDYMPVWNVYEKKRTEWAYDQRNRLLFEDILVEFINMGGHFVCNLAGHDHIDEFGYTKAGILNIVVQNGTTWDALGDMKRVKGTRSEDCFNVVAVDTELGLIKIIRIGANTDHYMRRKTALCYDYINKKVIADN